jgi:hypothetical protein
LYLRPRLRWNHERRQEFEFEMEPAHMPLIRIRNYGIKRLNWFD